MRLRSQACIGYTNNQIVVGMLHMVFNIVTLPVNSALIIFDRIATGLSLKGAAFAAVLMTLQACGPDRDRHDSERREDDHRRVRPWAVLGRDRPRGARLRVRARPARALPSRVRRRQRPAAPAEWN